MGTTVLTGKETPEVYINGVRSISRYVTVDSRPLPKAFTAGAMLVFGDTLHILGGNSTDGYTFHYRWQSAIGTWTSVSTLPISFNNSCACVYDGKIHIFNGSSHYAYSSSWTSQTVPDGVDTTGSRCIEYDGELHLLGGTNNKTIHYKWDGSEWSEVSTVPFNFDRGSVIVYNDNLHVIGGSISHLHRKWDGTQWTSQTGTSTDFYDCGCAVYLGRIYLLGSICSYFDGTWHSDSSYPLSLTFCSAAVLNDKLYYMGSGSLFGKIFLGYGQKLGTSYTVTS